MSEEPPQDETTPPSEDEGAPMSEVDDFELDDVDVRDLLRSALAVPAPEERKMTERIQKRIRDQSKGRFYADGWSTAYAPRATFLVTAALMLLVVVVLWVLLGPKSMQPLGG